MCILMGKIKQCFGTAVFLSMVFRLKMQKLTVLEKNDFECIFDQFEVRVVTVWKNTKHLHFCLW